MTRAHAAAEPSSLTELAKIVEAHSGLLFADSRQAELATKAKRALADSGCETMDEYLGLLVSASGAPLLDQLVECLTVGETYFFRHRPYFDLLRHDILPQLFADRRRTHKLRLWCGGCATGEEAYSIAILVREMLLDIDQWDIAILGTDLNRRFLAQAETGLYGDWSFRETDGTFKRTYFTREGTRYRISPEIRRMVRFGHLNLAGVGYPSFVNGTAGLDLIFCRNVLIYFAPELAEKVLGRLGAALAEGGCLVLGPSDPSPGPSLDFEAGTGQDAIVYRRTCIAGQPAAALALSGWLDQMPADDDSAIVDGVLKGNALSRPATATDGGWQAAWQLARVSVNEGRLVDARVYCQQAMDQAWFRPEPYYLMATLCEAEADDEAALAAFRKAIYLDRGFTPAYLGMAAIHRRAGRADLAHREISRAHRLLSGRAADEVVVADEGLTVGRLRDALDKGLARGVDGAAG